MVPSAVINEAIVFITAAAMVVLVRRVSREKLKESFRYFTVLSNVFCAFTALILLLSELFGAMHAWAVALKYMGTVAVTVTFLTVCLFLLPATRSIQGLFSNGTEIVMHLVTPLLAIFSFLCFENRGLSAWVIPLGVLPVLLYGWLYLQRVVLQRAWPDFYGFDRGGRWKLSFSLMMVGTVIAAVLLWAL